METLLLSSNTQYQKSLSYHFSVKYQPVEPFNIAL